MGGSPVDAGCVFGPEPEPASYGKLAARQVAPLPEVASERVTAAAAALAATCARPD